MSSRHLERQAAWTVGALHRLAYNSPCPADIGTAVKATCAKVLNTDAAAQEDKETRNEEDEGKGVEMEGDFEGDLFDLPSDAEEDDEDGEENADDEQRLDQEMGDVGQEGQVHILPCSFPVLASP